MNAVLYKQMVKVNLKGFVNFAIGSAFYMLIMFWLYRALRRTRKRLTNWWHRCRKASARHSA